MLEAIEPRPKTKTVKLDAMQCPNCTRIHYKDNTEEGEDEPRIVRYRCLWCAYFWHYDTVTQCMQWSDGHTARHIVHIEWKDAS